MNMLIQRFISSRPSVNRSGSRYFLCAAACVLAFVTSAVAEEDPPSRVGRIGYVEGDVSFYADRSDGWQKARLNYPVTSENSVWTQNQSRAEVRVGASSFKLDDDSILDFLKIGDHQTHVFLQRGTLNIRSRSLGVDNVGDGWRLETSGGRFIIETNGRYRLEVSQDGLESRLSVFVGRVRFESANADNRLTIEAGKMLIVRGAIEREAGNFSFERASETNFDRWALARDQSWDDTHTRTVRAQTISPYMTGYEDLDTYGDWIEDREYGRLWTPRVVVAGWAPYRYGSWAYVRPWGWTWIDDATWGFAPFHYGRWLQVGARWAWWPGATYIRRPIYAPALVAWCGQPGINISISVGPSIGWFPLAPREHYIPGYTNNATYIRNINHVTNNITVINPPTNYQNRMPGATFVNGNTFVNARPVQNHTIKMAEKELAAHPIGAAPNATPFPKEMGSRTLRAPDSTQPSGSATANVSPVPTPDRARGERGNSPRFTAPPAIPSPVPSSSSVAPPVVTHTRQELAPRVTPQPTFTNTQKPVQPAEAVGRGANTAYQAPTQQYKQYVQRETRTLQSAPDGAIQGNGQPHAPAAAPAPAPIHPAEKAATPPHEKREQANEPHGRAANQAETK